jgi:hypothetical protein
VVPAVTGYHELVTILGDSFKHLLNEPKIISKILSLAKRLEALHEYNPKQALFVAADIVRWRVSDSNKRDLKRENEV